MSGKLLAKARKPPPGVTGGAVDQVPALLAATGVLAALNGKEPGDSLGRYVVRLQAQGPGIETVGGESVVLSGPEPITVQEGQAGLTVLKFKISQKQYLIRKEPFQKARRFITNGPSGGGIAAPGKSFPIFFGNPIRVDVEIISGVNFQQ